MGKFLTSQAVDQATKSSRSSSLSEELDEVGVCLLERILNPSLGWNERRQTSATLLLRPVITASAWARRERESGRDRARERERERGLCYRLVTSGASTQ